MFNKKLLIAEDAETHRGINLLKNRRKKFKPQRNSKTKENKTTEDIEIKNIFTVNFLTTESTEDTER
jgi:hypothetical protein